MLADEFERHRAKFASRRARIMTMRRIVGLRSENIGSGETDDPNNPGNGPAGPPPPEAA